MGAGAVLGLVLGLEQVQDLSTASLLDLWLHRLVPTPHP